MKIFLTGGIGQPLTQRLECCRPRASTPHSFGASPEQTRRVVRTM